MQRFFYDTEFIEDGKTIDLVSIGVVGEDGREFYAVSTEFDESKASDWVRENVLAKLPPRTDPAWMDRATIADRLLDFLVPAGTAFDAGETVELWAYYAAYDHVALAQLWGSMMHLPPGIPMFTHELMQRWERAGRPEKPAEPVEAHDALADARWNRELFDVCGRGECAP
jgi:hypothetical protein